MKADAKKVGRDLTDEEINAIPEIQEKMKEVKTVSDKLKTVKLDIAKLNDIGFQTFDAVQKSLVNKVWNVLTLNWEMNHAIAKVSDDKKKQWEKSAGDKNNDKFIKALEESKS